MSKLTGSSYSYNSCLCIGLGRKGPKVRLKLPSFSGLTESQPEMLHYTCQIDCRVRTVPNLVVSFPKSSRKPIHESESHPEGRLETEDCESLVEVIGKRPIMAIAFDEMEMTVQEPTIVIGQKRSLDQQWLISSDAPSLVSS